MSDSREVCICGLHPAETTTFLGLEVYVCENMPREAIYTVDADVTSQDLRDIRGRDLPDLRDE